MRTAYCSRCEGDVEDRDGFCSLGHPLYQWSSLQTHAAAPSSAGRRRSALVGAIVALSFYAMAAGVLLQVRGHTQLASVRFASLATTRPQNFGHHPRPTSIRGALDPVQVMVWRLGIFAPVEPMGLESDGTLEVPDDAQEAGWFKRGPTPGERGAAVIVGHYDSRTGPGIFWPLKKLRVGDEVGVVDRRGDEFLFEITRIEQVDKDLFPTDEVYSRTSSPTLRLITCKGDIDPTTGHYTDNLIAYGRLVR